MRATGWAPMSVVLCSALVAAACDGGTDDAADVEVGALWRWVGHDRLFPPSRPPIPPPRLLAPLSSTVATSQQPLFRWVAAPRELGLVEVCYDRACTYHASVFLGLGGSARPPRALPSGTAFWRVTRVVRGQLGTSNVWQLVVPARDSGRAGAWGAVPDFDGDGFSDLAVSVKAVTGGAESQIRIFPGGPNGPAAAAAQTFTGPAGFGDEIAPAGDLDGDGFCDLAVWTGAPPSAVTVYRGGPSGVSSPITFPAPAVELGAQVRVASAGDVNGDGYGDLLVGGDAAAQLFLGGPSGVATTAAQTLTSTFANSRRVTGGADFNGDGFPDAIVASSQGGVQLYEGDGATLVPRRVFTFPLDGLAGDVNADGIADAIRGEVYAGGPDGTGGPTDPFTPFFTLAGVFFYAAAGDSNGDGFSDVLASMSSVFGVPEGQRLYFGRASGCGSTDCPGFVPLLVPGTLTGGPFIATGAGGVGDTNGDGYDDIVYFQPFSGSVFLLFGSANGPPQMPSRTIAGEIGFGWAVARL